MLTKVHVEEGSEFRVSIVDSDVGEESEFTHQQIQLMLGEVPAAALVEGQITWTVGSTVAEIQFAVSWPD